VVTPAALTVRPLLRAALRWGPPLAWMALIFVLSAQSQLPSAPSPWLDTLAKKAAHATEYAVLALLLLRALDPQRIGRGRPFLAAAAALLAVLYALSDELHQALVPGRHPAATDVLIDAAGAALAVILVPRLLGQRLCGSGDTTHRD
jgi:VanZ family protein